MATISMSCNGPPEFGPEIFVSKSGTTKPRILLGWNHTRDNPRELEEGKLWCWTASGGGFQVFDQNFNRSELPGEVRNCGVANFTMVRMFHPYWCKNGRVPQDMVSSDKRECRERYNELLAEWVGRGTNAAEETTINPAPRSGVGRLTESTRRGATTPDDNDPPDMPVLSIGRGAATNGYIEAELFIIDDSDSESDSDIGYIRKSTAINRRPILGEDKIFAELRDRRLVFNHSDRNASSPKREDIEDTRNISPLTPSRSFVPAEDASIKSSPEPEFISSTLRNSPASDQIERNPSSSYPRSSSMPISRGTTLVGSSSNERSASVVIPSVEIEVVKVKREREEDAPSTRASRRRATHKPEIVVLDE